MTAPRPNPTPPTRLPPVRLEVRTGSGQSLSHDFDGEELLIGGAPGCDLRLPAPNLPPVVCQISRRPDGIRVRRLAPGIPVLLNGALLPGNIPTVAADGDRLAVAGVEIALTVSSSGFLSPGFVPLDPYSSEIEALGPDVERLRQWEDSLAAREAEVARREQTLREERDLFDRDRL
jgi:predicted component of type VI protein secretion system